MRERGFAIIGTVVVIALAIALGFGGAIVLGQSNLVATAKQTQTKLSVRSHESLDMVAVSTNRIRVWNDGSVSSFLVKVLVKRGDDSLDSYDYSKTVKVLGSTTFNVKPIEPNIKPGDNVGVLTRLGNVFWEGE